jgi:hypothetical protein
LISQNENESKYKRDYIYELQDNIASAGLPAIADLESHPFKQPLGNDGSLLGSSGDSPKLH